MATTIPDRIDSLTPEWLTDALRQNGHIDTATSITDIELEPLGEGTGFAGTLARVSLAYSSGSGPGPMVVKIPTSIAENRAGSELMGVYEREIRSYLELLPNLEVPTPKLFHADIDPDPKADKRMRDLARAERLPIWTLRLLTRAMMHSPAAKPRASMLIVEDLAPAEVGDQVEGCSMARCESVVAVAAKLHASTWGDRAPAPTHWLLRGDFAPKVFHAAFLDARKGFLRIGEARLSGHSRALVAKARQQARRIIVSLHRNSPTCLLQGDLRLDNIFFDGDEVRALIDWQLSNLGPGVLDLAYFITGSLPADAPEADVDQLIAQYHRCLIDEDITDYSLDRLRADYDDAMLIVLHRMASIDRIDFGDGRGIELVDTWLHRLDARLRRVAV